MSKNKDKTPIELIKLKKPKKMEYYVDIEDSKKRYKFISRIERIVRSSMEYKDYIGYLKETVGLDSCIFFPGITSTGKHNRIKIEMHHEPLTLYDIVETVVNKYEEEGLPLNDLLIADEVMEKHFSNEVGLVPLSVTAHELVHNSTKLFLPLTVVYGNYSTFLDEYGPYVPDSVYEKIEKKVDLTKSMTEDTFNAIKKEYSYVEVDGFENVEKLDLKDSNNTTAIFNTVSEDEADIA